MSDVKGMFKFFKTHQADLYEAFIAGHLNAMQSTGDTSEVPESVRMIAFIWAARH